MAAVLTCNNRVFQAMKRHDVLGCGQARFQVIDQRTSLPQWQAIQTLHCLVEITDDLRQGSIGLMRIPVPHPLAPRVGQR